MLIKTIFITILVTNLYGCAGFFDLDRTFVDEMEKGDGPFFMAERDFPVVPGDTGTAYRTDKEIKQRTPVSKHQQELLAHKNSIQEELSQKEESLHGDDLLRYQSDKRYLGTMSEKIYYLGLSSSEKAEYITTKVGSMDRTQNRYTVPIGLAVMKMEQGIRPDVTLGMSKNSVEKNWGRPYQIDIAGDPAMQNERWLFNVQDRARYVYFENGKVQGWSW